MRSLHADHDTYGNREVAVESVPQPFGFTGREYDRVTGREYDRVTGLYHYRAREYDPNGGRFMQEDPIWFNAGDMNVYRYVGNHPLKYTDPLGTVSVMEKAVFAGRMAAVGGAIGAVGAGFACVMLTLADGIEKRNAASRAGQTIESLTPDPLECATEAVYGGISGAFLGAGGGWVRASRGFSRPGWRIAPFGNRTDHPVGRYPHYHRRGGPGAGPGAKPSKGGQDAPPGQGIGRHRPWESKPQDKSFWDRF